MKKPLTVLLSLAILLLAGSIPLPVQADNGTVTSYQDAVTKSATRNYYISAVIGTGSPKDPYRTALTKYTYDSGRIILNTTDHWNLSYTDGIDVIKGDKDIIFLENGVDLNNNLSDKNINDIYSYLGITLTKTDILPKVLYGILESKNILSPQLDNQVRIDFGGQIYGTAPTEVTHSTVNDNFNRVGTLHGSTLSDSSGTWVTQTGTLKTYTTCNLSGSTDAYAYANCASLTSANEYSQADLTVGNNDGGGITIRHSTSASIFVWGGCDSYSNYWAISTCNGTTWSLLNSYSTGYADPTGTTFYLEGNGNTITLKVAGVSKVTASNSWTTVKCGIAGWDANTSKWDNFQASNLASGTSISNTPSSKAFGVVRGHTTSYSGGGAYSNPVTDGQCALTITNDGTSTCNITAKMTDWTASGGNTWTLVAGLPDGDQVRVSLVYSGQDPSSPLILTTSNQAFISSLAASATKKWDIMVEFGGDVNTGLFSDGKLHTGTITLTAS